MRVELPANVISARRLNYWQLQNRAVEFDSIGARDDALCAWAAAAALRVDASSVPTRTDVRIRSAPRGFHDQQRSTRIVIVKCTGAARQLLGVVDSWPTKKARCTNKMYKTSRMHG